MSRLAGAVRGRVLLSLLPLPLLAALWFVPRPGGEAEAPRFAAARESTWTWECHVQAADFVARMFGQEPAAPD